MISRTTFCSAHAIEAEPERLREVTGIGPVRAKRITELGAIARTR